MSAGAKEWLTLLRVVITVFALVLAIPFSAFVAHAVWTLLAWGWGWGR